MTRARPPARKYAPEGDAQDHEARMTVPSPQNSQGRQADNNQASSAAGPRSRSLRTKEMVTHLGERVYCRAGWGRLGQRRGGGTGYAGTNISSKTRTRNRALGTFVCMLRVALLLPVPVPVPVLVSVLLFPGERRTTPREPRRGPSCWSGRDRRLGRGRGRGSGSGCGDASTWHGLVSRRAETNIHGTSGISRA